MSIKRLVEYIRCLSVEAFHDMRVYPKRGRDVSVRDILFKFIVFPPGEAAHQVNGDVPWPTLASNLVPMPVRTLTSTPTPTMVPTPLFIPSPIPTLAPALQLTSTSFPVAPVVDSDDEGLQLWTIIVILIVAVLAVIEAVWRMQQ